MYKGANRFSQARASSGRTLSGYPESRKGAARSNPLSGQAQFEAGTVYIKKVAPLVRSFFKRGLSHPDIADELLRRGIDAPSGSTWTASLVAQLVAAVQLNDKRYGKSGRGRGNR
jgi:hypothetical protein